ncbi:unnamed protein product [Urochloa humidicola]
MVAAIEYVGPPRPKNVIKQNNALFGKKGKT